MRLYYPSATHQKNTYPMYFVTFFFSFQKNNCKDLLKKGPCCCIFMRKGVAEGKPLNQKK